MTSPVSLLRLDTVAGAEDVLAAELSGYGTARPVSPGLVELRGPAEETVAAAADRLRSLAGARCFTGVALPLPGAPGESDFDSALGALTTVLGAAEMAGEHGFRIAVRSAVQREELASKITAATDWHQQPGNWAINLVADTDGWVAQIGPLHWSRRNGRLQRLPWSTPAALADVLVRMAKIRPGHRVLDPCCGSGTLLVAAGLAGADRLVGFDQDPDAIAVAQKNVTAMGLDARLAVGDAAQLESASQEPGVDRVLANLPFGKQVGSHRSNEHLYPAFLGGLAHLLAPDGRAVLLTEDKRLLLDSVQRTKNIKIIKQSGFRYSGATPTAYVITRRRR